MIKLLSVVLIPFNGRTFKNSSPFAAESEKHIVSQRLNLAGHWDCSWPVVLPKLGLVSSMRGETWMKQFPLHTALCSYSAPEKFQTICSKWKLPPAVLNCARVQALRLQYLQKAFRPGLHPGGGRGCSAAAALLPKGRSMEEKEEWLCCLCQGQGHFPHLQPPRLSWVGRYIYLETTSSLLASQNAFLVSTACPAQPSLLFAMNMHFCSSVTESSKLYEGS